MLVNREFEHKISDKDRMQIANNSNIKPVRLSEESDKLQGGSIETNSKRLIKKHVDETIGDVVTRSFEESGKLKTQARNIIS